ncbi:hypothetical protein [Catenulispora rubra]|uniref:hypothetical protein n=1 Tax=Catenulispora rubra TaxID=280293 RepID=UPI0018923878|nr:hypothetical protein [Catenulispora rubra]
MTGASVQHSASPSTVTLPGGDLVVYQGANGQRTFNVVGPDGRNAQYLKIDPGNGHVYVLPTKALSTKSLDISQYDVPQLSRSTTPASAPTTQISPRFPLHILQINANDLTGAPAQNALSIVMNVDSFGKFFASVPDNGGVARLAVPAGNYAIYTGFVDTDANGNATATRLVQQEDLVVPDAGGAVTVTAAESAASARVTAATPRPTVTDDTALNIARSDTAGFTAGIQGAGPGAFFISPEATPKVGKFSYQVSWAGESPPDATSHYRYDLAYPPVDNVPANEDFPVAANAIATLHNTFDTDAANPAHTGMYQIGALNPQVGGRAPTYRISVPEDLTDYLSAPLPAGFAWLHFYQPEVFTQSEDWGLFFYPASVESFAAGKTYWHTWAQGPLTPQVGQFTGANNCYICAADGNLSVAFDMADDSSGQSRGWYGLGAYPPSIPVTQNFTLYRDGQQIYSGPEENGALLNGVPQQTGTYRAVFDVDASGLPEISQSTKTHTDLSFVYHPAGDPHSSLPGEDYCWASQANPTSCQILPLLNLNYRLNTDATNTSHGLSILDLTVGHASFDGQGSHAPAASAKVEISFNRGTTWTPALTIPTAHNHYLALWADTGAKGSTPWLRVTATDTVGGSITQTTDNAYTIG